jgi:hypothetical protein
MKNFLKLVPLAGVMVWLCGCAGSHCRITANSVQAPVSCTGCVFDAAGKIREAKPGELVQHVKLSRTNWSMFWRGVPLNQTDWDISQEINNKLKENSGNALLNVKVNANGADLLDWYFAAILPIIPSYVHVSVEGDVARMP